MTPKERFMCALELGTPDRVPMWDWFDEPVTLGVAEQLGLTSKGDQGILRRGDETDESIDLYCRVVEELQLDASQNVYGTGFEMIDENYGRDHFGRTFMTSAHGEPLIVEPAVRTVEDIKRYDMRSFLSEKDFDGIRRVVNRLPDRAHSLNIKGPFAEAWTNIGGMDKMLLAFVTDPDLARAALRMSVEFTKDLFDLGAEAGVDFIVMDGDLCGNDYMLMSYEHFREFIYPCKQELVEHAHGLGLKIIKHTDGMAWRLMDDFLEIGFDGFHPIQPQCMDLDQTKAAMYGKMCVVGNVDCLDLLVFGTPDMVDEATKQVIADGAPGGGYILSSSNSLHPGCKPENVIAMFRAGLKYGDYANIAPLPKETAPPPDGMPIRPRRITRRRAAAA